MSETKRRRRPGRPSSAINGVISVCDRRGRGLGWSDGEWGGNQDLVVEAQRLVSTGAPLTVPGTFGRTIPASSDDPVAAMAVMAEVADTETGFRGDIPLAAIIELAKQAPATSVV